MKSYPYIARNNHDVEFLVFSETRAVVLSGVNKGDEHNPSYFIRRYKNITHEYLQNTYGEVVSPEHAEFIRIMCDVNKITVNEYASSLDRYFVVYGNELLFFHNEISAAKLGGKQITIPLPPKQIQTATPEEEFEMTQIMKNAGDNLVLGCEDSKCGKWPKIGDEVLVYSSARRLAEIKDKVVKVIGKCTHSDGDTILTVEHSSLGVFAVSNGSWIQKPKTPEEELRVELYVEFKELINMDAAISAFVDMIETKHNITKKPQ